jgi:hypothetical protein
LAKRKKSKRFDITAKYFPEVYKYKREIRKMKRNEENRDESSI